VSTVERIIAAMLVRRLLISNSKGGEMNDE